MDEPDEVVRDPNDGVVVSIYLRDAVLRQLDRFAEAQERSRSWMVNKILSEKLGVIDDED